MFDAAYKALEQMFSPPFRAVLFKSLGLVVMIVLFGIGLHSWSRWLAVSGATGRRPRSASAAHRLIVLLWLLSIAAALGIVVGAVFLMPAVTAFVGSFFVDEIAARVEREYYPADMPGKALPLGRAVYEGSKIALISIWSISGVPFILFAGVGLVILFVAAAYLLSREYFELAAMRFRRLTKPRPCGEPIDRFHRGMFIAPS